jgi:hypothetical protein
MSGFYAQKLSGLLKNTVKVEFFFKKRLYNAVTI